jgi:NAD(P)-dependent dehydrogenase (short-subunit alcohol dehydrogenase family)
VQVSSVGGIVAFPSVGIYSASKYTLEAFSESLAQEVADFGIKVTLIEPGSYATDPTGASAKLATPLPAYDEFRGRAAEAQMAQVGSPGDPVATREAILKIVDAENPPLRVFFGAAPLGMATTVYESRLAEWRAWEPVSLEAHGKGKKD